MRLAHGPDWLGGPSRLTTLRSRLAVVDDGCVFAAGHREGAGQEDTDAEEAYGRALLHVLESLRQ